MTHICVSKLTIIGSDNGLSPGRRQAITWTNVGILLIGPLGTNFSEMLIKIQENPFENVVWKMAAILSWPQCVKIQHKRIMLIHESTKFQLEILKRSMISASTKFQLKILKWSMISAIHKFWENGLESLRNISETPLRRPYIFIIYMSLYCDMAQGTWTYDIKHLCEKLFRPAHTNLDPKSSYCFMMFNFHQPPN